MTPPALLEVRALSKRYGETVALDGADITFTAGMVHAVLGENGSGKSTLVKLLSGIVAPSSGSILIEGTPVTSFLPVALQRRGVGTVFQEVLIAPDRSVADNILLGVDGLWRRRVRLNARGARAAELMAEVARTAIDVAQPAAALPLAQRQLVVLARALAKHPRILILDEVTAALDYADRESVFAFMRRFTASGGCIIFITHRIDEVTELSDRLVILRSGRVVRTLARDELDVPSLLGLMAPERLEATDAA